MPCTNAIALSARQLWLDIFFLVRIATCLVCTELGDNPPVLVLGTLAHPYQHVPSKGGSAKSLVDNPN